MPTSLAHAAPVLRAPHRFAAARDDTCLPARLYRARQVHGTAVLTVDGSESVEAIADRPADAIVTRTPGVAVSVRTADCVPVLLHEQRRGGVAAVHAGWRGLVAGVVEAAVSTLLGSRGHASDLRAAIGPCIGPCCFEVGPEVAREFEVRFVIAGEPRPHVDLPAAVRAVLSRCGVGVDETEAFEPACTRCDPRGFFSYRRSGPGTAHHWHYISPPSVD